MDVGLMCLVVTSALLHAVWNIVIKGGSDKLSEAALNTNGGAVVVLFALPFLPLPAPEAFPYLIGSVCVQFFYYLFLAYAYKGGDFGFAYPLMRGAAPLLTVLVTTLFLGQPLSFGGGLGIGLLSLGILTLTVDCARRGTGLGAWRFALAGAASIAGYTVIDGTGVRLAAGVPAYICWGFLLNTVPVSLFTLAVRGRAYIDYAKKRWRYGLAGGLCSALAYGISVWAMSRAPIALVAALRETSVIFGMLLGVLFLRERFTVGRAAAVLLVVIGAVGMKVLG